MFESQRQYGFQGGHTEFRLLERLPLIVFVMRGMVACDNVDDTPCHRIGNSLPVGLGSKGWRYLRERSPSFDLVLGQREIVRCRPGRNGHPSGFACFDGLDGASGREIGKMNPCLGGLGKSQVAFDQDGLCDCRDAWQAKTGLRAGLRSWCRCR